MRFVLKRRGHKLKSFSQKRISCKQGETFSTAIVGLTSGLSDVKGMLGELRAERRGGAEQTVTARDNAADLKPMIDAIAALTAAQSMSTSGCA